MERWRDVIGYEGLYQVSNLGVVRSVDRVVKHYLGGPKKLKGKVLRAYPTSQCKYLAVNLCKKGVRRPTCVHRLVAAAWIGPCPDGQEVRHGPAGVAANSVSNLCYGTRSENNLDCRRDGTHGGVAVVRSDGVEFISMAVAAERSGCWYQNICKCCKGELKTTGSYGWRYKDE
jgi:hypothetical protein